MAAQRKPCPYDSPEALRAAIVAVGSVEKLARDIGVSGNLVRRWAHEMDVETRTGKVGRRAANPYATADELRAAGFVPEATDAPDIVIARRAEDPAALAVEGRPGAALQVLHRPALLEVDVALLGGVHAGARRAQHHPQGEALHLFPRRLPRDGEAHERGL